MYIVTTKQVLKVNGTEIDNLEHLCELVENCSTDSLHFDLDDNRVIVLNYETAKIATSRILKRHKIPSAMSADLWLFILMGCLLGIRLGIN
ncbi:unnamed protein product [Trifolium pratense]|uniref:Uncharacterized protein n=1 Tax=Trifolium pratense TaxID=57577 RepID=A0ACB0JHP5_TRIPR|nr:unnamed protein product [Trifolium pratense]